MSAQWEERKATLHYLEAYIAHMESESGRSLRDLQSAMLQTLRVMHRNIKNGKHVQLFDLSQPHELVLT